MYIIHEDQNTINQLRSKYLVLELDTLQFPDGKTMPSYAVVDREHIPLHEAVMLEHLNNLHQELITVYRNKNWNRCDEIIESLRGNFRGEMDSFYDVLSKRISTLRRSGVADDWTGNILTG